MMCPQLSTQAVGPLLAADKTGRRQPTGDQLCAAQVMIDHAGVIKPTIVGDRDDDIRHLTVRSERCELVDRDSFDGRFDTDVRGDSGTVD